MNRLVNPFLYSSIVAATIDDGSIYVGEAGDPECSDLAVLGCGLTIAAAQPLKRLAASL